MLDEPVERVGDEFDAVGETFGRDHVRPVDDHVDDAHDRVPDGVPRGFERGDRAVFLQFGVEALEPADEPFDACLDDGHGVGDTSAIQLMPPVMAGLTLSSTLAPSLTNAASRLPVAPSMVLADVAASTAASVKRAT